MLQVQQCPGNQDLRPPVTSPQSLITSHSLSSRPVFGIYGVALNLERRTTPAIEFNIGMFDQEAYMRGTGRIRADQDNTQPFARLRIVIDGLFFSCAQEIIILMLYVHVPVLLRIWCMRSHLNPSVPHACMCAGLMSSTAPSWPPPSPTRARYAPFSSTHHYVVCLDCITSNQTGYMIDHVKIPPTIAILSYERF